MSEKFSSGTKNKQTNKQTNQQIEHATKSGRRVTLTIKANVPVFRIIGKRDGRYMSRSITKAFGISLLSI